ncbi:TetR/AcrR family transcriptional regulator [Streptomyces sp. WMMC500]|uniref:TetR/AcrR family transcriptional regulator n=1 Tax=Streptomyces sp. WMMC500 TaxID=3015154 RepID=UPI00248C0DB8|nr:TetR/AcrR family transcriptional regulator [Streptomyces sp. WMMC500]WBB58597.1 TetR/AcrR family transcriptional regulator [Streptomyces sp. WMMC500]
MAAREHSGDGDLSRSMALLWGIDERGKRGPKPGISVDRIVFAAIRIADAEGLEAVSMRKIAGQLGVGTMSLYRHVPGKAELLDLMLDAVGSVEPEDVERFRSRPTWRARLRELADSLWEHYLEHPWLLHVDQGRPVLGPNGLDSFELALSGFDGLLLTDQEKVGFVTSLDCTAAGLARVHVNAKQAEERTGISDQEFWEAQSPALESAMTSGRYPRIAKLADDSFSALDQETFVFATDRMLDGLEALLEHRRETGWTPPPVADGAFGQRDRREECREGTREESA